MEARLTWKSASIHTVLTRSNRLLKRMKYSVEIVFQLVLLNLLKARVRRHASRVETRPDLIAQECFRMRLRRFSEGRFESVGVLERNPRSTTLDMAGDAIHELPGRS